MLPKPSIDQLGMTAGFLAATFDGFTALFPAQSIVAVEQRANLTDHQDTYAMYRKNSMNARVFSLSRALQPTPENGRPYFIIARYQGGEFGLACDELQVINSSRVNLKLIPTSLKCGDSPIEAFAQFGKRIVYQCSLEAIAALLPLDDVEEIHEYEQGHPA